MASLSFTAPLKARFGELVATMSERDRRLFVFLVVFGVSVVLGGSGWLGSRYLGDVESRISDREHTLGLLNGLNADYAEAAAKVEQIEDQLRKNAGQDLQAFMEKSAQKLNIQTNLKGVREKSTITEGTLEEKVFTVELDKVSLQQFTDFLYEIETGGYPLRVRATRVKTVTAAGVKSLNVSMEVSAYRLTEEAPPPPAEEAPE